MDILECTIEDRLMTKQYQKAEVEVETKKKLVEYKRANFLTVCRNLAIRSKNIIGIKNYFHAYVSCTEIKIT